MYLYQNYPDNFIKDPEDIWQYIWWIKIDHNSNNI